MLVRFARVPAVAGPLPQVACAVCVGEVPYDAVVEADGLLGVAQGNTAKGAQDRLVVDETNAEGSFEVDLHDIFGDERLVAVLREQLGIVTTPSRRDVRMLVVRPANQV